MLADYASQVKQGIVWVLTNGEETCGFLVSFPENHYYFVENIAVFPKFQGHGYGAKLMTFAESQARALGLSELHLYTNVAMIENIIYYAKLGYKEIDRRIEGGYSRIYMRKILE
jgi:ribosomal protein S18 acetylase RimI-like enzyme